MAGNFRNISHILQTSSHFCTAAHLPFHKRKWSPDPPPRRGRRGREAPLIHRAHVTDSEEFGAPPSRLLPSVAPMELQRSTVPQEYTLAL
eukprot:gene12584-biopygen9500